MDTKQELIERWCQIIPAVFRAEDVVQKEGGWRERLKNVKDVSDEERARIADEYVLAIAREIVG